MIKHHYNTSPDFLIISRIFEFLVDIPSDNFTEYFLQRYGRGRISRYEGIGKGRERRDGYEEFSCNEKSEKGASYGRHGRSLRSLETTFPYKRSADVPWRSSTGIDREGDTEHGLLGGNRSFSQWTLSAYFRLPFCRVMLRYL